jgi:DNA processing protein
MGLQSEESEAHHSFASLPFQQRQALIGLTLLKGVGAGLGTRLLSAFQDATSIFTASEDELCRVEGIGPQLARRILQGFDERRVDEILQTVEQQHIHVLVYGTPTYPQGLCRLSTPPPLLYIWSPDNPQWQPQRAVALVGTRQPDRRGVRLTEELTEALVHSGFGIISGGALGIDTAAHTAALRTNGQTIAIVATGVDRVYPPQNRELYRHIRQSGGAIVSEHPPGTMPEKGFFPQRNRLIAAMSEAVVVVQCRAQSGALNTATHARKLDIPVMTLPGRPREELAAGPHKLLREGALLVETGQEVASLLQKEKETIQLDLWSTVQKETNETEITEHVATSTMPPQHTQGLTQPKRVLDPTSQSVYEQLRSDRPLHIDEIAAHADMSIHQVSSCLFQLELEGWVQAHPGMRYTRVE